MITCRLLPMSNASNGDEQIIAQVFQTLSQEGFFVHGWESVVRGNCRQLVAFAKTNANNSFRKQDLID